MGSSPTRLTNPMYRPLPNYLTIRPSSIHGVGVFSTSAIPEGIDMGISHHFIGECIVRTPLGGFVNHSEKDFNCRLEKTTICANLVSIREILKDEELTVCYQWYTPASK